MSQDKPTHLEILLKMLFQRSIAGVTHFDMEAEPIYCTTIRSAVSDLEADFKWPIIHEREANTHNHGKHCRYFLDFGALERRCGIGSPEIKRLADLLLAGAEPLADCETFLAWVREHARAGTPQAEQADLFNDAFGRLALQRQGGNP